MKKEQLLHVLHGKDRIEGRWINDKYALANETTIASEHVLHRVKALKDLACIGQLGGWVETERNLSVSGNAWVAEDAHVFGDAQVLGDSLLFGDATVSGNARVSGNA